MTTRIENAYARMQANQFQHIREAIDPEIPLQQLLILFVVASDPGFPWRRSVNRPAI